MIGLIELRQLDMILHSLMTSIHEFIINFWLGNACLLSPQGSGPLGILLSHLLHLNSLSELTTKTQVCLERDNWDTCI